MKLEYLVPHGSLAAALVMKLEQLSLGNRCIFAGVFAWQLVPPRAGCSPQQHSSCTIALVAAAALQLQNQHRGGPRNLLAQHLRQAVGAYGPTVKYCAQQRYLPFIPCRNARCCCCFAVGADWPRLQGV
eukprot:GHRQ01039957.1.p1 GENE.GHRQ01039957.1~~GHRQ01039957.1.p1  ORF type:complete len:129 (+),score=31.13 GHRQ01039957.1:199-585(+)